MRGIGQMARECGLTVSALRFYDGAGVLVPARVDPQSNYRWYSDGQVLTARLIARLRRVGMPLADVCRVLEHRRERPVVEQVLQAHLRRLEDGLADARRELSAALSLLDLESPMTTTRITTTGPQLAEALRSVRHAVGTDPDLPVLTGVLLEVAGSGTVHLAATDRYRLAVCTVPGATADGPPVSVVAPTGLVDDVLAALDDGDVTVTVDGDGLTVETAGRALHGQPLPHDFPDHHRLLRTESAHRVDVDVAALRAQLAQAPTRTVRREQDGVDQEVAVLTLDADGALRLTGDAGGVLEMGLDREFLLQALTAAGAGQLVLELDGPLAPLAIRAPGRLEHVSLLMPVQLS